MAPSGSKKLFSISEKGLLCGPVDEGEIDSIVCSAAADSKFGVMQAENGSSFTGASQMDVDVWRPLDDHLLKKIMAENGISFPGASQMDADVWMDVDVWSTLDDHLLEKIMARLPLKSLFQASSLSKTWRLTFCSDWFQSDVHNSSASWNSYAPLFVKDDKSLLGYERRSKRWCRLPTHSYLPDDGVHWYLWAGDGSLLCWIGCIKNRNSFGHILVTNPLTKSWKHLPPRPVICRPGLVHLVREEGCKAYKVILGSYGSQKFGPASCMYIQIFDSTDGSWTLETFCVKGTPMNCTFGVICSGSTVINGVLYMLVRTVEKPSEYKLISLDLEEKIWNGIPHLYQAFDDDKKPHQPMKFHRIWLSKLFLWESNVMLVISARKENNMDYEIGDRDEEGHTMDYEIGDRDEEGHTLTVFRLDLERGLAFEVSRGPTHGPFYAAACDGDCIYIGRGFPSIIYNLEAREWRWINFAADVLPSRYRRSEWRWTSIKYQPGLNPFLKL